MSLNTWSKTGSEKAQASQTIRILLKTLQYLAEDNATDSSREKSFLKVATAVIKNTFTPSDNFSVNEQVSVVFNSLGWKNTQVTLTSADEAEILLGSNRHLDQDPDSIEGLKLLTKTLATALGSYIFDRDVDAFVDIDIHTGPTYNINLKAVTKMSSIQKEKEKESSIPTTSSTSSQTDSDSSSKPSGSSGIPPIVQTKGDLQIDQIFLPVLSNKLDINRLHSMMQDVLLEFSKSWYGEDPLANNKSEETSENIIMLSEYLIQKAEENNSPIVEVGSQIGNYFGSALMETFNQEDLVSTEILEGSAEGSIIRDIKARAFCHLRPGDKCGPNIGTPERQYCDFYMGIWQGTLSELLDDKDFKFSGFYPAGRRDPYCLMEFEVN